MYLHGRFRYPVYSSSRQSPFCVILLGFTTQKSPAGNVPGWQKRTLDSYHLLGLSFQDVKKDFFVSLCLNHLQTANGGVKARWKIGEDDHPQSA